jgi:alanine dehydrogenase
MRIGVPKERKSGEHRVGLTPAAVAELTRAGHEVFVQTGAGAQIGFSDADYLSAGARLSETLEDIYRSAQLLVKVKEPMPEECDLLNSSHILFTFLHLAADSPLVARLQASLASCIAYETVTDEAGRLPLLAPMSEVAGRLAVQAGAHHLEIAQGGRDVLMGGVPGVPPAHVLILGAGSVGSQAARVALGMGARVTLMDNNLARLRELDKQYGGRLVCIYATQDAVVEAAMTADLVIGAVLIPGATAPRLLEAEQVAQMLPGSVLVDVAIDQGGCFATSRPTTHQQPTYVVNGVIHYCVTNIPSAAARTATMALTHASLPYVQALAAEGMSALNHNRQLLAGLNLYRGQITLRAVADSVGGDWHRAESLLPFPA